MIQNKSGVLVCNPCLVQLLAQRYAAVKRQVSLVVGVVAALGAVKGNEVKRLLQRAQIFPAFGGIFAGVVGVKK